MLLSEKKEFNALNIAKLIMAVLVLLLHAQGDLQRIGLESRFLSTTLFRLAVPFFFLTTGFFSDISDTVSLKRKSFVLIKIWLTWSVIYTLLFTILMQLKGYHIYAIIEYVFWRFIYDGSIGYHLWYLLATVFGLWICHFTHKHFHSAGMVTLATIAYCVACVFFCYTPGVEGAETGLIRNGLFIGFPFICAGYIIRINASKIKKSPHWASLFILSALFLLEYLLIKTRSSFINWDVCLTLAPLSVTLFLQVLFINLSNDTKWLSKLSLYVYLIHPAVFMII